jgi:hypothetical protein
MKPEPPAIFISESPEFNPEEGTESMSYVVYVAQEFDDEPLNGYTRCWTLDEAFNIADEIKRKHPYYELVGLI